MPTPRCDALAREHTKLKAAPDAPGVVQDWIALAQRLERDLYIENGIASDRMETIRILRDEIKALRESALTVK